MCSGDPHSGQFFTKKAPVNSHNEMCSCFDPVKSAEFRKLETAAISFAESDVEQVSLDEWFGVWAGILVLEEGL